MTEKTKNNSSKGKSSKDAPRQIAQNKKARFDYFIEEQFEAGISLEGWEVKSLREGRVQLTESYVIVRNNEAFLFGSLITPLLSASTHINPDSTRTRKLLLKRAELDKLVGKVERSGYTIVPLNMHWTRGRAKLEIGLAKGKKQHDKRATIKDRDWERQKGRILKHG